MEAKGRAQKRLVRFVTHEAQIEDASGAQAVAYRDSMFLG